MRRSAFETSCIYISHRPPKIAVCAIGFSCFSGGFAVALIGADPTNSFSVWQWLSTIALTPVNLHLVALGLLYASSRDGDNKPRADRFSELFYVSKMLETGLESVPCAAANRFMLTLALSQSLLSHTLN